MTQLLRDMLKNTWVNWKNVDGKLNRKMDRYGSIDIKKTNMSKANRSDFET